MPQKPRYRRSSGGPLTSCEVSCRRVRAGPMSGPHQRVFDKPLRGYFVISAFRGDALGVGAAGESVNVTQIFQPSGRFSAANSL